MRENVDWNNSEYGHFLRSENDQEILISKGFSSQSNRLYCCICRRKVNLNFNKKNKSISIFLLQEN